VSGAARLPGDQATVTVTVALNPEETFRVFTAEIDLWWRRGPRFRNIGGDRGIICIEPRAGGRVFESIGADVGAGETVFEIGRIKIWEPPRRLLFDWRNSNFAAGEHTEVEVVFEPAKSGTRVTVVHRGWAQIRPDHPARHALQGPAFTRMIGLWWADQMTSLREHGDRPVDK
jgi:uncharacterized protein YndB with AHSA1/START domain